MTAAKIVIAGYYGFDNLGDELILESILDGLGQARSRAIVLSRAPKKTFARFGVASVNRWLPWSVFRAILRSNAFILGGGGLLQDRTSFFSLIYYLSLLAIAALPR